MANNFFSECRLAPFNFDSETYFVGSSDGNTLQVYELTTISSLPESTRTFIQVANISIHPRDHPKPAPARTMTKMITNNSGLLFPDGRGKIERREALTKLAQHLSRLRWLVNPYGDCFQDNQINYLQLEDPFPWPIHLQATNSTGLLEFHRAQSETGRVEKYMNGRDAAVDAVKKTTSGFVSVVYALGKMMGDAGKAAVAEAMKPGPIKPPNPVHQNPQNQFGHLMNPKLAVQNQNLLNANNAEIKKLEKKNEEAVARVKKPEKYNKKIGNKKPPPSKTAAQPHTSSSQSHIPSTSSSQSHMPSTLSSQSHMPSTSWTSATNWSSLLGQSSSTAANPSWFSGQSSNTAANSSGQRSSTAANPSWFSGQSSNTAANSSSQRSNTGANPSWFSGQSSNTAASWNRTSDSRRPN